MSKEITKAAKKFWKENSIDYVTGVSPEEGVTIDVKEIMAGFAEKELKLFSEHVTEVFGHLPCSHEELLENYIKNKD